MYQHAAGDQTDREGDAFGCEEPGQGLALRWSAWWLLATLENADQPVMTVAAGDPSLTKTGMRSTGAAAVIMVPPGWARPVTGSVQFRPAGR